MRFSSLPLVIGFGLTACLCTRAVAQVPSSKADAIVALDELSYDNARFERMTTLAKSLGVSDARIVLARFANDLIHGDFEKIRRSLPEIETAVNTVPPDESAAELDKVRETFPKLKKVMGQKDPVRLKAFVEDYKRGLEVYSIQKDLGRIEAAVDTCALKGNLAPQAVVPLSEWLKNVPLGTRLRDRGEDIFGNQYGSQVVGQKPVPNPAFLQKMRAN